MFRSTDNGENWMQINSGLTNTNPQAIAIDSGNQVFVGTTGGVFKSSDNGDSWVAINDGLAVLDVRSLAVSPGGYVLAGTAGGGVFLLSSSTAIEENLSSDLLLEQNHPNPFYNTTTIRYHVPSPSHVKIEVFDLFGRKVGELVDATESPGTKTLSFDAANLDSGIYLYRLQTGEQMKTKRMTIIK
jgi:hypothetical protein